MNEEPLKRAYEVPALSEEAKASIRGRVQTTRPAKAPRWRLAAAIGAAGLAGLAVMPMARANYLGYWLAGRLKDTKPFTVSISLLPKKSVPGVKIPKNPIVVTVANGICTMTDEAVGRDTIYLFDRSKMYQFRPEDGRAIVREVNQSWVDLLTLPEQIANEAGRLKVSKEVEFIGSVSLKGRQVNEWIVDAGTVFGRVVIDIDPVTGAAVRMVFKGREGLSSEVFDYDRDEAKALSAVTRWKAAIDAVPKLDVEGSKPALMRSISATPMRQFDLPKDHLIIYRVEQNLQGDVFVLYTCDGKHKTDEQMGNWIRLMDSTGTQWLSDVVDMNFSGLKLNGQFAKAQVFFHPKENRQVDSVRLFARMDHGEFEHNQLVRPMIFKNAIRRDFGSFAATPTLASQPDWIYYSKSINDTSWLTADAMKLRFIKALNSKDYKFAQKVGQQLESNFPEMLGGFFYSRQQLSLGLYHAFRGAGDLPTARAYLRKATEFGKDDGDYDFQKDLNTARKQEGL